MKHCTSEEKTTMYTYPQCFLVVTTEKAVDMDEGTEWATRTTCPERGEGHRPSAGENFGELRCREL